MTDYPYPPLKETVFGTEVSILGVEHNSEFFEQYQHFFIEFIAQQDAVVLEQVVGGNFWNSNFFREMGRIAESLGKRVYQVDPATTVNSRFIDDLTGIAGLILLYKGLEKMNKEKMSRRNFLKGGVQIAAGTSLVGGTYLGDVLISGLSPENIEEYMVKEKFTYGDCNYRNIVIAEGLERICKEVLDIQKIGAIHGAAHSKAVHSYLAVP